MQILGKRSKALIIAVAILLLTALGLSFALWDTSAVKAAGGDASVYANAKVGDIVTFGQYYQEANSVNKTPIEWIVVDKDERCGQVTLFSKYILAYGSYFGNYFTHNDETNSWSSVYNTTDAEGNTITKNLNDLVAGVPYNQSWAESNPRAFLNNLERHDLGGDIFTAEEGLSANRKNSRVLTLTGPNNEKIPIEEMIKIGELYTSVGFSNARYHTKLKATDVGVVNNSSVFYGSEDAFYQRARLVDPSDRLARNGYLDEAFSAEEKHIIVPKVISGQASHRWPVDSQFLEQAKHDQSTTDKVWLPSVEELNIKEGVDWADNPNDAWTNPSELESSTPFEYFKNYKSYGYKTLAEAIKTTHTAFAGQPGSLGNFSIPGWIPNEQLGNNTTSFYWTRSAPSHWHLSMRSVTNTGKFYGSNYTYNSNVGVRPCIILQY